MMAIDEKEHTNSQETDKLHGFSGFAPMHPDDDTVTEAEALNILDQQVREYNQTEHDARNSAYNEVFGMPKEDRIIVDCHPGAGSRATIALDREDYQKIRELAADLDWD